jgi:hypothetical protein
MIARALAGLLLALAVVRAQDPGVIVKGVMSHFAKDVTGDVWAVNRADLSMAVLRDRRWEPRSVPGLPDGCRPLTLQEFEDGDVGCLWENLQEGADSWVLTRHRSGESRVVGSFRANLRDPMLSTDLALFGAKDGRVFVTGPCRIVVGFLPGQDRPKVVTLPDHLFLPPARKHSDGSVSSQFHSVRALVDHSGDVWLWSLERQPAHWSSRLRGLVRAAPDLSDFTLFPVLEGTPPISVLCPWDQNHLALAVEGTGLFLLDQARLKLEPLAVPDKEAFKHVEQLFHDGTAWHAVTTPRTTETEYTSAKIFGQGAWETETTFYDRNKPTCSLWRREPSGDWRRLFDGLDKDPCLVRPWIRTTAGLFLGSDRVPWFFPADGSMPRRLGAAATFSLYRVGLMLAVDERHVLLAGNYPCEACLWPADSPLLKEKPLRWEEIITRGPAYQDPRGRFWCLTENSKLIRWDGRSWSEMPPPPPDVSLANPRFVLDDRDRGWVFPWDDDPTAIFDFASETWQSFPSLRQALVAQLPRGVKLPMPEPLMPETFAPEPVFSADGRIGAFAGRDRILHFAAGRWREWKFGEIARPDDIFWRGHFYFAPDGAFSLPLGGQTALQWHGPNKGWLRVEDAPMPDFGLETHQTIELPDGLILDRHGDICGTRDRHGVMWFSNRKTHVLRKNFLGREVPVLTPDERNPLRYHASSFSRILVDDAGHALLDTTRGGTKHYQILLRARLPAPQSVARLLGAEMDTARLAVGGGASDALWHTWRVDGGAWQPLQEGRELTIHDILPGPHTIEVRAFNADLTPAKELVSIRVIINAAAETQFAACLRQLAGSDVSVREAAARTLKSQGPAALPNLRAAREAAPPNVQWWLDAVIQHIERQSHPR